MNIRHYKLLGIVAFCSILSSAVSCNSEQTKGKAETPEYTVLTLDTTTAVAYIEYSTVIQSNTLVEIRPNVSGYLEKIAKNEGESVRKGELIFKIRDADFVASVNAANAAVKSAEAAEANAALEVRKLTPLVEKGITSPFELETAKMNYESAKANLAQAKANYENSLITLGYTEICAPVDGVLGRIYVREGSLVSPSAADALTTVSSFGDISAYFTFDEKNLSSQRHKMMFSDDMASRKKAAVELVLADGSLYQYKGYLERASGIIDRTTGSIQMKAIFPNPYNEVLSGSSGLLRFPLTYKGCIVIPQNATYELQDKTMAYVVNDDNTVTRKVIMIEGVSGQNYVVSNLPRGTRIVVEGVDKLKDGMVIKPKEINADSINVANDKVQEGTQQ